MPCIDPPAEEFSEDLKKQQEKLDSITRMLCTTLTMLENVAPHLDLINAAYLSDEIKQWWIDHKQFDKEQGR